MADDLSMVAAGLSPLLESSCEVVARLLETLTVQQRAIIRRDVEDLEATAGVVGALRERLLSLEEAGRRFLADHGVATDASLTALPLDTQVKEGRSLLEARDRLLDLLTQAATVHAANQRLIAAARIQAEEFVACLARALSVEGFYPGDQARKPPCRAALVDWRA